MITLQQAQRIINELGDEFDSHGFIEKYMSLFERDYVNNLVEKIESDHIFRTVNASIGRFLADNQKDLRIAKNDRETSKNVKGNDSENQGWVKRML